MADGTIKHALNPLEMNWMFHNAQDYPCVTKVVKAAQMKDLVPAYRRARAGTGRALQGFASRTSVHDESLGALLQHV